MAWNRLKLFDNDGTENLFIFHCCGRKEFHFFFDKVCQKCVMNNNLLSKNIFFDMIKNGGKHLKHFGMQNHECFIETLFFFCLGFCHIIK